MKLLVLLVFLVSCGVVQAKVADSAVSGHTLSEGELVANPSGSYRLVEKVLFPLGENTITLSNRNQMKKELKAQLIPSSLLLKIFPKKTLLSDKEALLNFLIAQKIVDLSLNEKAFSPQKQQMQAYLQQLKGSLSLREFRKKLKENSLTLKSLKKKITQSLKRDFFVNKKFVSKIVISDSDINGYFFNTQGKNLFTIFEYEFSFLSFKQTKEGLKKARQAFNTLPASFSNPSKQQGGRFEKHRLKSGEMSQPMEQALKNLSVSQFSPLTPIGDQVYIFKLNWKTPIFTQKQEKERRRIYALLLEREFAKVFHKWLEEKKSHYSLSYL